MGEKVEDPYMKESTIRVVIIGAGSGSCALLSDLMDEPGVDVIGIWDSSAGAPGLETARRLDIPIALSHVELLQKNPDVIINATGDDAITQHILRHKPDRSELIAGNGIKVFMNLIGKRRQSEANIKGLLTDTSELFRLGVFLTTVDTLDGALDIILREAMRVLRAPAGSIALYDEKSNSMVLKVSDGFEDSFSSVTHWESRKGGMTDHILTGKLPTVISDVKDFSFVDNKVLLEAGIKSLIAVPFLANSKIVGILYIDDFKPRQWTTREVDFLILLSVQAAFAIEKFKLIEDIRDAKTYLKNVLDNSADIIVTTDTESRIVEFNKGASRILGYAYDEMTGTQVDSLWVRPEERNEILGLMNQYGYVSNYETQLRAKNGHILDVNLTLSYISDGNGGRSGTVGISKDITEKKRLEREIDERSRELRELNEKLETKVIERTVELRKANKELERSNTLKSKFIATMSHELRTPLNSILGFSELLVEDASGPLAEKQKRYATNIYNSGSHLLQLINNILDLAKIESGRIELNYDSFPLQTAVAEVESVIRPLADKKKLKLEIQSSDEPILLKADRIKFKQILYNLLSNSVKFTPDGGSILLEAEAIDDSGPGTGAPSEHLLQIHNSFLRLSVSDTGIGIKKEDHDRIFAEFEQVDSSYSRRYEGTGLGLSLTKKLIELHGGEISVESEEGVGSKFIVIMPLVDKATVVERLRQIGEVDVAAPHEHLEQWGERMEGGPLILVVEDDLATSELMTLYLVQGGYRVARARNGDEALSRAYKLKPFAVILDVMLPGKDGWEILQEMKSDPELKEIPVIISSVINNYELGFALGASDYLVKPVDRNSLFEKLNSLNLAKKKARKPVNILCIDDDPKALELLTAILEPAGYTVITSDSGKGGIEKAIIYQPDLIILDLMIPDLNGFEVTRVLKDNPAAMDIPIFILTAKDITMEERLKLAGKVENFMQKSHFTKEHLLRHIKALEIMYPARAGLLDELSGLFNHYYFQIRLAQEICRAQRYKKTFSVILVDIDHFSEYVKANGVRQANICIRKIAEFLRKSTRGSDTIVRYGVDEFAIILSNTMKEVACVVAKRILSYIDSFPFYGEELMPKGKLTASISITNYPLDAVASEEIMFKVHDLMKEAKTVGGGTIRT
jgi:diguanylate cyclase (GGDEF)-like protein/PAS domain S-box-containing protein